MKKVAESPVVFNNEGMQIVGMLHKSDSLKKMPAVVFFHGCTGSKTEANWLFVKLARSLAENGITVLRFDFRFSGDSEGDFERMTLTSEISDGLKSIEYLVKECNADPKHIGILGLSMGGAVGAVVAGSLEEKIKSCVLINPVAKPLEDISALAFTRKVKISSFPIEWNSFLFGIDFFEDIKKIKPLEIIKKASCPFLVVNGSNDKSVLPIRSQEYVDTVNNNGGTAELYTVEGADHVFSSVEWEQQLSKKVSEWFISTLK